VALASDICRTANDCTIGGAGIVCIFASILWAGSAYTTLALQKRPEAVFSSPAPVIAGHEVAVLATPTPEEVVTKTVSPDGTLTTTYTTTITNPDGSKTVSETTEVTPPECR
jgi:hypothetical protein